jgi:hypothetical protein
MSSFIIFAPHFRFFLSIQASITTIRGESFNGAQVQGLSHLLAARTAAAVGDKPEPA